MDIRLKRNERNRIVTPIKASHATYFAAMEPAIPPLRLKKRFRTLARRIQDLTRKEQGSANTLKIIPNIVSLLFGLQEDILRQGLPPYSFHLEKRAINARIIKALDARLSQKYAAHGAPRGPISWGESLLNCYVDLFITFTVLGTPKELGAKPTYLVNPTTGSYGQLEIDIEFEEFRLAFEFQGHPSHYSDPRVIAKDAFKLKELPVHSRILIPVNVSQLHSRTLQNLIANTLKEFVGVHAVVAFRDPSRFMPSRATPRQITLFCKAVQRLFLAETIFRESLDWIDAHSAAYVSAPVNTGTVSATTAAPRAGGTTPDIPFATIYANLKYVAKIKKR